MDPFYKLKNFKTLFVDDDEFIRDSFGLIFAQKTCPLTTVSTAEEGLQRLEADHYDIIISDFQLPGMNGVEFFKKAHHLHPDSVNVLVSGNLTPDEFAHSVGELKLKFIPKPFNVVQLAITIVALKEKQYENSTDSKV